MTPYRLPDRIAAILAHDQKTDVDSGHLELAATILAALPHYADLPATDEQAFANEKVKALVETLKFYVYDDNWQNVVYEEEGGLGPSPINQDHGCKARAALAAMELHNPTQEGTDK